MRCGSWRVVLKERQGGGITPKGNKDANLSSFAYSSRSALLLGHKLQQRRALGWSHSHGTIYVSQHRALETA
jgi:hypothetical protein